MTFDLLSERAAAPQHGTYHFGLAGALVRTCAMRMARRPSTAGSARLLDIWGMAQRAGMKDNLSRVSPYILFLVPLSSPAQSLLHPPPSTLLAILLPLLLATHPSLRRREGGEGEERGEDRERSLLIAPHPHKDKQPAKGAKAPISDFLFLISQILKLIIMSHES